MSQSHVELASFVGLAEVQGNNVLDQQGQRSIDGPSLGASSPPQTPAEVRISLEGDVSESSNGAPPSINLVWRDLRYFVPNPSRQHDSAAVEELELLKGITGWALPGKMTALMGGSGAGELPGG